MTAPLLVLALACRGVGTNDTEDTGVLVKGAEETPEVLPCGSLAATEGCPHSTDLDRDCLHDAAAGGTDCDDNNPEVGACGDSGDAEDDCVPSGDETCNGLDDDCDGLVDDAWSHVFSGAPVVATVGALGDGGEPLLVTGILDGAEGALLVYRLDGELLVRIDGTGQSSSFGSQLATGRDLTGDGLVDLAVAAPYATAADGPNSGRVWVLPGPIDGDTSLDDAAGYFEGGELDGQPGGQLVMAPDLDGDGRDELVFGYYRHVVLFSGAPGPAARLADARYIFEYNTGGGSWHFATAPDHDGDGRDELLLGMPTYNGGEGAIIELASADLTWARVFEGTGRGGLGDALTRLGTATWTLSEGTPLRLDDALALDVTATALANGGDVDGDGLDDLLVTTPTAVVAYRATGAAIGNVARATVQGQRNLGAPLDIDGDGLAEPVGVTGSGTGIWDTPAAFSLGCDGDGDGYSPEAGDCDDDRDDVAPGQVDTCDGTDNDCDGHIDAPVDLILPSIASTIVLVDAGDCGRGPSGWTHQAGLGEAFGEHEGASLSGLYSLVHGGSAGPGGAAILLGHGEAADYAVTPSASGAAETVAWGRLGNGADLTRTGDLGPAGDLDGDGIGEAWQRLYDATGASTVAVYDGPVVSELSADDAGRLVAFPAGWSNVAVAHNLDPSDLDGDGLDDLLASSSQSYYGFGRVAVLGGLPRGALKLDDVASADLFGEPDEYLGSLLAVGGDLDGDGFDDALVGANGHARVLAGGPCPELVDRRDSVTSGTLVDLDGDGLAEAWTLADGWLRRDGEPARDANQLFAAPGRALVYADSTSAWALVGR
ncbi:MAG: FG-GAP repeat protein [Deltaproteobacteria bacterium]|nr:FG-GAP repeat protein [Deltaproteobacteria bacterium]